MKKIILFVLMAMVFCSFAEAAQVPTSVDVLYEQSKLPTNITPAQAYTMTDKFVVYRSDTPNGPWVQAAEFLMSGLIGTPPYTLKFIVDLADGQLQTVYYRVEAVLNTTTVKGKASNVMSLVYDLRPSLEPTIRSTSSTLFIPASSGAATPQ